MYHTLSATYHSLGDERIRLYELAGDATGVEKARILDQVHRVEETISSTSARMRELLTFVEDNVEDARGEARRSLSGSRREEAMERLAEIQEGLLDIHAEEEEMRRVGEQIEAEILPGIAEAVGAAPGEVVPVVTGAREVAGITGVKETEYDTVIGWWRRLGRFSTSNSRYIGQLRELREKLDGYEEKLRTAEGEGNNRSVRYYTRKIEETQEQITGLLEKLDKNTEEQAQLMANLARSLSDALYENMGGPRRHFDNLMRIYDEWGEMQEKVRSALDARGEPPAEYAVAYGAARSFATRPIEEVYSEMIGVSRDYIVFPPRASETEVALEATRGAIYARTEGGVLEMPPVAIRGRLPETRPFEVEHRGRRYRIEVQGQNLEGMDTEYVYGAVQALVRDRRVTDEELLGKLRIYEVGADGETVRTFDDRAYLERQFFERELGYRPTERQRIQLSLIEGLSSLLPVHMFGEVLPVPEGATYFEYRSPGGNRYRIRIEGEDLSGMTLQQVYERVKELAQDSSIRWGRLFGRRKGDSSVGGMLFVERLNEDGSVYHRYIHRRSLEDAFFREQLGWIPGMAFVPAPAAPPAVAAEAPPAVAEVVPAPIAAPPAEAVRDVAWARAMRSSIFSRFPALQEFVRERDAAREEGREYERQGEMDRFLAELVRDYVEFRSEVPEIRREAEAEMRRTGLGIGVVDEIKLIEEGMGRDGRRIARITGMSARELVAFAESYFAGIPAPAPLPPAPPAAPEVAEVEPVAPPVTPPTPPVAPPAPTVAEAERPAPPVAVPPVTAPPVAAPPVEVAPAAAPLLTQERAAEVAFNYMRMLVSEPEARRISEYISGRRVFGRLAFSAEETATRVFDALNPYIQRFRLNPLVLVREEGRLVLTDAPRPPRTETIIENLARDNMNFTEEVAAWAVDQYNDVHPDFPVAVEGWFTPAEIFQRGRMIEILSSSLFRALRSMNDARYRVDRGNGMETVDAYDFGAYFVFDHLGRHKVELSESEAMVGQFSNEDIQVLFAWVASCFTGNHENLYDNLFHAVDPSHATADPNYSGMRISRANLAEYNRNFEEFMAALPSEELRAAIDYNAFILGAMIRTYYVRQYGEPATEEAAAQLDTACINAGRVIILGQMEAEMSRNWHSTFTYNGEEYMLGTHLLTRLTGQGIMIDGQVRDTLLVLPTADPLEVHVVGYWERGRMHILREGGGDAIANVRLEETPEGESYIPHHVSGRDSLGNGLTVLWCYPSPGYLFGERMREPPGQYEDILAPPYTGLGAEYEDVAPPTVSRTAYQELTIGGQFGLEQRGDYNRGERIDDAFAVIQNPTIGADEASMNPISFEDLFKEPNVWIEFNNFRRVAEGEDHYYATMAPEVARDYADMFENAEEIQHVAELRNGRVYIYVNAEGKIVDALSDAAREDVHGLPPEGQEWLYSFTLGRDENDFPVIMRAMLDVPAEYRRLIMARVPSYELRTRMAESDRIAYDSVQNRVDIELTTAYQVRAGAFDTERILPYAEFSTGPVYMRTEALRGPLGDMFREETARLAELHEEFDRVADTSKRTNSSEEERAAERRLAEILIERKEIYDRMLAETEAAIGTAAGEEKRVLEGFRDAINANLEVYFPRVTAESLRAYIASTEEENYYSHAYMQVRWDELQALHLEFNRLSANYYAVPEENVAERDRIATEGWRLVLRRRELYEEMLGHIDTSTVATEESLAAVNAYRAQIEANFAQHMADVDYAALREEFGR